MNRRTLMLWLMSGGAAFVSLSCIGRDPPSIQSQDPDALIRAIRIGVDKKDKHIIPYLVADLESDDPAIRMYAIDGLKRLTDQDFGYVYFDEEPDRHAAVVQWKQWLADHPVDEQTASSDSQGK